MADKNRKSVNGNENEKLQKAGRLTATKKCKRIWRNAYVTIG